ncbi:unnamed protein product [Notodromas monacha]|uniref:Uncharacterized protein n=1 Tax=Notodromas monacha TaxID=399045 RepID=A0A7R9GEG1_9CRUS|nr:unnamed protein product [Notodromas monacha]CAG0917828.1 unnamed protein product [Notodromas monacha]
MDVVNSRGEHSSCPSCRGGEQARQLTRIPVEGGIIKREANVFPEWLWNSESNFGALKLSFCASRWDPQAVTECGWGNPANVYIDRLPRSEPHAVVRLRGSP